MEIIYKKYDELERDELYDIFKLREEVFIVEQKCAYLDIDNFDKVAIHIMMVEEGELVG